ncbi:hypothetical protein AZE42_04093 [Rhizopogon vesiculosus]|uniref:Uncharacterized protein n=1 Tax=Rhizopogon vesiculosus TaxID=180088 RepID=A0A1J8R2R2_9AGAM|nr:hypothetical protein AZE42_04093 [Rhizopogon vesiculosus]
MFEPIMHAWTTISSVVAEEKYPEYRSRPPQEDMTKKRTYGEQETSGPKMRPYISPEETGAKAMETIPREASRATTSSRRKDTVSYSRVAACSLHAQSLKEEVNSTVKAGARAPPQMGEDSSQPPDSLAINSLRHVNNAPHSVQSAEGNMQSLDSYPTPHDSQLLPPPPPPPPPPAAARSRSSRGPDRGNQGMEMEMEQLRKELASANESLDDYRRENEKLVDERKRAEAALQVERSNAEKTIREMTTALRRAQADAKIHNQELDDYRRENEKLVDERKRAEAALQVERGNAEKTIRDMTTALHRVQAEAKIHDQELRDGYAEKRSLRHEVASLKGSIDNPRALEAKVWETETETETELTSSRKVREVAKIQLKVMSEQIAQLNILLKNRTFEPKGAQSFLTTTDASSNADAISMVQRLNAETLQSATYMAETMVDAFSFQTGGIRDENACGMVKQSFGPSLAHYLATKKHKDDPLLIQITFQLCLVQFLDFIIRSWTLPREDISNKFASIYEQMRLGEAQAVSGRWRALTVAYASSREENQLIARATSYIAGRFANIMLAAGCSASPDVLRASAEKKLSDRIVLLFKLATQLKKIIMEEITSTDLRTVTISGGVVYSAEVMEDAYVDGDPAPSGVRVLCTTNLGLNRTTRLATSGETQWDNKLLLKPKVALETVVNSMDE